MVTFVPGNVANCRRSSASAFVVGIADRPDAVIGQGLRGVDACVLTAAVASRIVWRAHFGPRRRLRGRYPLRTDANSGARRPRDVGSTCVICRAFLAESGQSGLSENRGVPGSSPGLAIWGPESLMDRRFSICWYESPLLSTPISGSTWLGFRCSVSSRAFRTRDSNSGHHARKSWLFRYEDTAANWLGYGRCAWPERGCNPRAGRPSSPFCRLFLEAA